MYSELPADIRSRHPFYMYDEIAAQPAAVGRAIEIAESEGREVARALTRAHRIFLTGCGTSFNAAWAASWFFRSFTRGKLDAQIIEAFDLANYLPGLRPDDVIIALTHSGSTPATLEALSRGRRSGCETIAVTGFPESEAARAAHLLLPTGYAEERSWAHTASYTAALTVLAEVANTLAEPEERLDLSPLAEVMTAALGIEEVAHRLAGSVVRAEAERGPVDLILVAGGPHEPTVREGMLKLLETSYARASVFGLEEMLHGPLVAVEPGTLVILVVPSGRTVPRAVELAAALNALGVEPVVIADEDSAPKFEEAHRLVLPATPETISPIPSVVPLQLFAYFLAVGKGINPDLLRRDDERYRAARATYR